MAGAGPFAARPTGDIGLAELEQDVGGKAKAIVADLYGQGPGIKARDDLDLGAGEIDGIFDQRGQGVHHLWQALNLGRLATLSAFNDRDHANSVMQIGLNHLIKKLLQRHAAMDHVVGLRLLGQAQQDVTASGRLRDQQFGIFAQVTLWGLTNHLLGHDRNGGQRRAQLVRRCRCQSAEGGKPLFAGQDRLGDAQGQFHSRRLC